MITSPNGIIFRLTCPLWGESTDHQWIPLTKTSDARFWCILWSAPEQTIEQQNNRDASDLSRSLWRHSNGVTVYYSHFRVYFVPGVAFRMTRQKLHVSGVHSAAESLHWCQNGHDSVANHQPHDCKLNRLFRHRSKKISKLRVTGLCAGNSPETGEFPAQMASNAENVSIWWRHHDKHVKLFNQHCDCWWWWPVVC